MSTTSSLSIGEFSALSRLSVRMLRHYDAQGLLAPAAVDPFTGRRRYEPEQLSQAGEIRRLRDVGFGVAAIAHLLAARGTQAYASAMIARRAELQAELGAARERLALFDHLYDKEGHAMPAITVSTATVPAQTLVSLRGTVADYSQEGQLWERLMPLLAAAGVSPAGPCGVIEHDGEFKESDVDETVWVPVAPGAPLSALAAPVRVLRLPVRETVVARVQGPYSLIAEAHSRIAEYAQEHGLVLAAGGPAAPAEECNFNVYLSDAADDQEAVTEVHVPMA